MAEITIKNDGVSVKSSAAISILNTLLRNRIAIDHRCGGRAQCGTCRVRIVSGERFLSPIREREQAKLAKFSSADLRLACQTYAYGDVTIEIVSRQTRGS